MIEERDIEWNEIKHCFKEGVVGPTHCNTPPYDQEVIIDDFFDKKIRKGKLVKIEIEDKSCHWGCDRWIMDEGTPEETTRIVSLRDKWAEIK